MIIFARIIGISIMQQRAIKNFFRPVNSRMKILDLIIIRPGFVFKINEAGSAFIGLAGAVDIAINERLIRIFLLLK